MSTDDLTTCILIPCHNEENTIRQCVLSCLEQTERPDRIIVVNDGSTDRSGQYLAEFGELIDVVTIPTATGNKSYAQQRGLEYITEDVFITTDGDTILDENFVSEIKKGFADPKIGAAAGYVKSLPHNFFTSFRELDYLIGQDIHKRAQSNINFLMVIPGCAGAFRTELFKREIKFDHDTLTEDLDFTYKMHKTGYKIAFKSNAVVYTQDPETLSDYVNQMRRWYAGGWQNLRKHINIIENPRSAFELSLTFVEGLLSTTLFMVVPIINFILFTKLLAIYLGLLLTLGLYASIKRNRFDLFLYSPLFLGMMLLNAFIFMEQFIKEIILKRKNLYWFQPNRRSI